MLQALNRGLLPSVYPDEHYAQTLRAYVRDYLKVVDGIEILPWRQFLDELWDSGLGRDR